MQSIEIRPERLAELEDYAVRRGQDTATALDDALAAYFEWERQDFESAVEGIRLGLADMDAGRTRPAEDVLESLRREHGLPG